MKELGGQDWHFGLEFFGVRKCAVYEIRVTEIAGCRLRKQGAWMLGEVNCWSIGITCWGEG